MRILATLTLLLSLTLMACSKQDATPTHNEQTTVAETPAVTTPVESASSVAPAAKTPAPANQTKPAEQAKAPTAVETTKPETATAVKQPVSDFIEAPYLAGRDYEELAKPVKTITGDKIEVTEVFSYGCIHCFHFEPAIANWEKNNPDYIEFVRTHATGSRSWTYLARVFYTAKALNVLDKVHSEIFNSIHRDRKRPTEENLIPIFEKAGITKEVYDNTFKSFAVTSAVQTSAMRTGPEGFNTAGTPELIVDGRYKITTKLAGSHDKMLLIASYLADKVERERKK